MKPTPSPSLPPKEKAKKIAIIGSGVSAQGLLIELLYKIKTSGLPKSTEISLIEKQESLYVGVAYNQLTNSLEHNVNMEISQMSFYGDFVKWLKTNKERIIKEIEKKSESDPFSNKLKEAIISKIESITSSLIPDFKFYPPRFVFGLYLQDNAISAIEELKKLGVKFNEYSSTEVSDIILADKEFILVTNNEKLKDKTFDDIAVCTGHFRTKKSFKGIDYEAYDLGMKHKIIEILLQKSRSGEPFNIRILGSGLTGIDAVKSVKEALRYAQEKYPEVAGVTINIDIFSRNALLPRVRADILKYKNTILTESAMIHFLNTHEQRDIIPFVIESLASELENAYKHFGIEVTKKFDLQEFVSYLSRSNSIDRLKSDYAKVENDDIKYKIWQTVYRNASACFDHILEKIGGASINRDLEQLRSLHLAHIAPSPLHSIQYLLPDKTTTLTISKSNSESAEGKKYDLSIDATGQDIDLRKNPLLQNLRTSGLAKERATSNHPNLFFAGVNKETTGLVSRSLMEGAVIGGEIYDSLYHSHPINKNKTWADHPSITKVEESKPRARL